MNSYFLVRDSLKESKFNNLVSISSNCQQNAGSTRAHTVLNSSLADHSHSVHLDSLSHSQFIKEHVQNEVVSKMLINRIREKTGGGREAKVEDRPQSAGLKYLHKIQTMDRENVNPHINVKRPAVFPPSEDYEELEKRVEC